MSRLLFVYGTLKRGYRNHVQISAGTMVGAARTAPGYRLYDMGGFPGLFAHPADQTGVVGEVWAIEEELFPQLDEFEGVPEGLYRRRPIPLLPPFNDQLVETYLPGCPVGLLPEIGSEWVESI